MHPLPAGRDPRRVAAAKVEAAERIIAQLTAMLEDVRRPWWRRLIG
jgi:hypothetical protein